MSQIDLFCLNNSRNPQIAYLIYSDKKQQQKKKEFLTCDKHEADYSFAFYPVKCLFEYLEERYIK